MKKPETGTKQDIEEIGLMLLSVVRKTIGSIRGFASGSEIRGPQALFLMNLYRVGTINMRDLALCMKLHPSLASRFIDRLARKGLVEREHDENDRRVVRISLTESGREIAEGIIDTYLMSLREVLGEINQRDSATLLRLLAMIDERLESDLICCR